MHVTLCTLRISDVCLNKNFSIINEFLDRFHVIQIPIDMYADRYIGWKTFVQLATKILLCVVQRMANNALFIIN